MSDAPVGALGRRAGQVVFAAVWVGLSALLVTQIGTQTRWIADTDVVAQPRFWPAVGLALMLVFGGLHLWHQPRRRLWRAERQEAARWARPLEFALWFMAYVWAVPWAGFLPTSLVFAPLLTWRLGYRGALYPSVSAAFACAVVIVFKGFLSVRIPGGAVYELLPSPLRSFAILWL